MPPASTSSTLQTTHIGLNGMTATLGPDRQSAMAKQSRSQQATVGRVMHEYKHGELESGGSGAKVKNPKQAIAIALHEAGATREETPAKNRRNLRRTKEKERKGETAQAAKEGKKAQDRTLSRSSGHSSPARDVDRNRNELYAEARRREIPGRSKMSKEELVRALRR